MLIYIDTLSKNILARIILSAFKALIIINERERFLLVNNLLCVQYCMFQETFDPSLNLEILHNKHYEDEIIFVKGEDQGHISEVYEKENNIKIIRLPRTPVVSTRVGVAPEILPENQIVERDSQAFISRLKRGNLVAPEIPSWSWRETIKEWEEAII